MQAATNEVMSKKKQKLMRIATYSSVVTASLIIVVKVSAWIYTDSLSLLASLADSTLDVISSVINMLALHYALQPADENHRFGHGKAEDIAAFAQSAFIAGSALFIVIQAIGRAIDPHPLQNEPIGIAVMLVSVTLTLFLVTFQKYVVKQTGSSLVKADLLHYSMDLVVNAMVICSLVASMYFGLGWVDTILAFIISAYIFRGAWGVGRPAFDSLMDAEMPESDRAKIIECVLANKNVHGMHDLRTRVSGMMKFIQFHVELDGSMTLKSANKIADDLELSVGKLFPSAEVIVHQDPENDSDEESLQVCNIVPEKKKKSLITKTKSKITKGKKK